MENNRNNRFLSKVLIGIRIYVAVIVVFVLAAVMMQYYWLAIVETGVLGVVSIYYFINRRTQQQQINNYIENLAFHLDSASKDSMIRFPLPMTVLNLTGNIVWYNQKFGDIVGETVFDKPISQVVPHIRILDILENKNNIDLEVDYQNRHFQLVGTVMEFDGQKQETNYSIVLYWIDRTQQMQWKKRCEDIQAVSGTVLVDNFEELIKNTPDENVAPLITAIDQRITHWLSKEGGVFRKTEKDRYAVVFENASLQNIVDQKFEILDVVRDINVGNTIPPTLSIGMGRGGTLHESDEFSRSAVDMALGRGGDQAVVKDLEKMSFFGGRSEGVEKNTRVKSRVVASALRELLDQSKQVFISGHEFPDADSFGAAVGLCKLAKQRGANCHIVCNHLVGATQNIVKALVQDPAYQDTIINEAQAMQLWEEGFLMIVVDTHRPDYVDAGRLLSLAENVVLIDHHRRGNDFLSHTVLTYHEPYASSTCEMVAEMLQYADDDLKLTPDEAQALFAGIALDTKNFTVKTGVRTFEAASYLRRMGVDTLKVKRVFQSDLSQYQKRAKIVSTAQIYHNTLALSSWEEPEPNAQVIASQAADELLNISNVNASFVICQSKEGVVISGRSLGTYNVQVVMEQLGGGGHMTIAGTQLRDKTMHEAMELLKKAIDEVEF